MSLESEKSQIEKSKQDPSGFEPLYLKYYPLILKFVYKRVEDLEDCREITSVVFTKAVLNLRKYKDQGFPFSSWLFRIAINEINQFYRDSSRTRAISIDEKGINNIAEETGKDKTELISILGKALIYLSEDELLLIELRYFEERPFSEVAQLLSISESNAKIKTYRIIDKLKSIYAKLS